MRPSATKEDTLDEAIGKPVAAVERAISILDAFIDTEPRLSLAEISRRTGLYKSTILRLVSTLITRGYLARTESGEFHAGISTLRLARSFQRAVQPQEVVLPILRKMVEQTGETASYIVRQGDIRICLYRINSPQILRDHGAPGDVAPLEKGAAGRILMAFADLSSTKYADIRKRLVAITYGELHDGMAGIAAPVVDGDRNVIGVLGLTGPESRFSRAAIKAMEKHILEMARELTVRLGGDESFFNVARRRN